MKVVILASGSKGNSTYIEDNDTKLLIDIGVPLNYVEEKLKAIEVNPKDINCILITHTHSDHISGLKSFVSKYDTSVLISPKMEPNINNISSKINIIYFKKEMDINGTQIKIIKNSHDSESYGFIINEKLVYITDTGYLNSKHFPLISNKYMYIIESNHDIEMLMNGKYPHYLKHRILSDKGHLSNEACSKYLSELIGDNTKYIVLAHLSEENNTPEKALEELNNKIKDENIIKVVSSQTVPTEVFEI
jgi:phosphoribosyl 1,2-cyclic phosphodiesterase